MTTGSQSREAKGANGHRFPEVLESREPGRTVVARGARAQKLHGQRQPQGGKAARDPGERPRTSWKPETIGAQEERQGPKNRDARAEGTGSTILRELETEPKRKTGIERLAEPQDGTREGAAGQTEGPRDRGAPGERRILRDARP